MNVPRFACLFALLWAASCSSSFGLLTEPIGTSSATQTATVTITTAGTLQTISVLTQGALGLDFNAASGGTCVVGNSYGVGNTCTVNYTFKPTRPWIRYGGIALADRAGNLLGNTYLTGTGTGPQPIFISNKVTTLASSLDGLRLAVDGSGNVYVAESYPAGAVRELVAENGRVPPKPTIRILGSGFIQPYGVAVDGSGNVYIADAGSGEVKEMVAVNGSIPANPVIRTLGSLFNPVGLAVDGSGNVYFADQGDNTIKEILAVNGVIPAYPTINVLVSGEFEPFGVAVDGSGNVYFADYAYGQVDEIVAVNGSIPIDPTINVLGSGFGLAVGVAVDGSGNVYVADNNYYFYSNAITEIMAVNGSIPAKPTIKVLGSGFADAYDVAVDGSGNVYIADGGNSRIAELNFADPPNLSFAATPVGATTGSQSVTLHNLGNSTLAGNSLPVSPNWNKVAGSRAPEDCAASFSLIPGGECNLSLTFEPTEVGALTGTATFTDNALNAASATQEISLSGTGTQQQLYFSPTSLAFSNLAFGQQQDMSLRLTNNESAQVTFAPAINGPSFTVPSSKNGCGTVVPAGHSCTFSVRFLPRTYGGHSDTLTLTGAPTVRLAGQTIGVGAELGLLDFGTIPYGTTAILHVPVVNRGVAQNVTIKTSINGPSFQVPAARNTCRSAVTAGAQCTIAVEFSPAAVGGHGDVLTITASSGDVSTVKLYGIASQP